MKDEDFFELVIQLIPIVCIISYVLFPFEFTLISYSVLGKLLAVTIILLYSFKHIMYGVFTLLLMIWYYQFDIDVYLKEGFDKREYLPAPAKKKGSSHFQDSLEYDGMAYKDAYPDQLEPVQKEGEAFFRKKYCRKNKLLYKDMEVNDEYAPHVYPEMKFRDTPCNPCDVTCGIELQKMKTESELLSKTARGNLQEQSIVVFHSGEPYIGTKKEQASFI
jgi:hypothetical protein